MSLLLDALKKAAEQKAQKSKQGDPAQRASDEILLKAAAADVTGVEDDAGDSADDGVEPLQRNDENEIEHTELKARLERGERIAGDDTGLDFTDHTDSRRNRDRPAADSGDETGLDYPDANETRFGREQPDAHSASDETDLTIPDPVADQSEQKPPPQQPGDDTDLNIPEKKQAGDEQKLSLRRPGEETGLDISDAGESPASDSILQMQSGEDERIAFGSEEASDSSTDQELNAHHPAERSDNTDLSQVDESGGETGDGTDATPAEDDQTDISVPVATTDKFETASPELPSSTGDFQLVELQDNSAREEEDGVDDEDLSLMLVESEQASRGNNTTFTNPQIPEDRAPADSDASHGELGLVDTTESEILGGDVPEEKTGTQGQTLTNTTAPAIYPDKAGGTLAAPTRNKVTRSADTTSTRTHAPDNYDRTLMKLPNDDASKLFAGMKPDADVVMTPDYAKKVFRSKTSAQRAQNYKYYAGIAIILLLAIAIYGGMEYQDESDQIDASMRPLKRDPMPGLIKSQQSQETNLFADTDGQVDARTIEIIQTASDESSPGAVVMVEPATGAATGTGSDTDADAAGTMVSESGSEAAPTEVATITQAVTIAAEAATATSSRTQPKPLRVIPLGDAADTSSNQSGSITTSSNSTLQIKTSSAYREVDIWLREAYAAYQAGNTKLAMSRYNQVLEVDPGNRNALLGRAAINIHKDNIDAAIVDYRVLLQANPKDSLAMSSLLGVASYSPLQTESQLKLMIRDEPESPYLNFALANAFGAQNRWPEAQGYYFRALQNNPGDPNYAYNLAVSLEHISQPVSAITYYQRALENFNNGLATFSREVVVQRLEVLGKL